MTTTRPAVLIASTTLVLAAAPAAAPLAAAEPVTCTAGVEALSATINSTDSMHSTYSTDSSGDERVSPNATGVVGVVTTPGGVRNLTVGAGDRSAVVTWDPPADTGGLPLLPYYLRTDPFGEYTTSATVPGRQGCTITGLTNGTTYTVTVAARNVKGLGPVSMAIPFTPQPQPAPAPVTPAPGASTPGQQTPPAPAPAVKPKKAKHKATKPTVRLSPGNHRSRNRLTVRWHARHASHVQLTWRRDAGKPHTQRTSAAGRITLAGPLGTRYRIRVEAGTAQAQRTYRIR